ASPSPPWWRGSYISTRSKPRLFRQVICADKESHEYAGSYHDIHDDLDYREMLTDLGNWLERHLEKKPAACGSIPSSAIDVCAAIG
ncbi:MAG: hypothetical protein HC935_06620, partial [Pseudanabaena sp. SU_2_4]|nr:hypothetical protein [Pseudanabaena sp. SU_2_4]